MRNGSGRAVISTLIAWMAVWLFPALVIEGMANLGAPIPNTDHVDMWPAEFGFPGLVGAVVFCALLVASRRGRAYDELPVGLLLGLGAGTGVVLGFIFMGLGWIGGASTAWEFAFAIGLCLIASLAAALALRLAARRRLTSRARA